MQLIFGTRGSDLARTQAQIAEAAVGEKCGVQVRTEVIWSRGEEAKPPEAALGRKGLFTAELESALVRRRIDVAVHSAKDLPSETNPGLTIAAALPRGSVEDVLVTRTGAQLSSLPQGARIATGSVRRQRQSHWLRPDLEVLDLRGNVPTRLRKFAASDWDAIILARAGLERLGFFAGEFQFEGRRLFMEVLPVETFVPAGGQGVIALQTRAKEAVLVSAVDHEPTHRCLIAEREFLRLLQGDCNLPVGVHARYLDGEIDLQVQLFGHGTQPQVASGQGRHPEKIAEEVFRKIEA